MLFYDKKKNMHINMVLSMCEKSIFHIWIWQLFILLLCHFIQFEPITSFKSCLFFVTKCSLYSFKNIFTNINSISYSTIPTSLKSLCTKWCTTYIRFSSSGQKKKSYIFRKKKKDHHFLPGMKWKWVGTSWQCVSTEWECDFAKEQFDSSCLLALHRH